MSLTYRQKNWTRGISKLKFNKSPGSDGLAANFYKHFWNDLREFLLQVFLEAVEIRNIPPTIKQEVIVLITKPGKDTRLVDNIRPITLLNNDDKLMAHIFAMRLKTTLPQVSSTTKSGFMNERSIYDNIRLILDILDQIEDNGHILFLDFKKAFNMIECIHS